MPYILEEETEKNMQLTGEGLKRVLPNCINGVEVAEMTQSGTVAVVDGRRGLKRVGHCTERDRE